MERVLKVNDFFCGCGGMGIAFKNAGYEIARAWDFDKYAVQTYKENVGDHVKQTDIREMTYKDVPKADVWAFGFPCQDLSVAGKQKGMILKCDGCGEEIEIKPEEYNNQTICPVCGGDNFKAASRSGMFFEMMRLLEETEQNTLENMPDFITPEDLAADITKAIFEKTYLPGFCFEAANDCIFHLITEKAEGHYIASDKPEIKRDWKAAENAIKDILSKHAPGGYMGKVIYPVLLPLKERIESGERTAELFNAIVEATR